MIDHVPPDHRLDITAACTLPRVFERAGGWIAQLGTASDAIDSELDTVIAEVEALLAKPRPRVVIAPGGVTLPQLFAPNNPNVMAVDGLLLWVLDTGALGSSPALVGRFVDQLRKHRIAQTVFVTEAASPRSRAVIAAIQSVSVGVRELEPPDYPVLVEVVRPDGVVLSVLYGKPCAAMPLAGLPEGMPSSVARAPRLRALLLASTDASRAALYAELVVRDIPLVVIVHTDGMRRRKWDNGFHALPVYADRASLLATARDMGMAPDSYSIAEISPRALFAFAHERGWALALDASDDKPRYIGIDPAEVSRLAQL